MKKINLLFRFLTLSFVLGISVANSFAQQEHLLQKGMSSHFAPSGYSLSV